jgi:hypothetical protein
MTSKNHPDCWAVLEIKSAGSPPILKILAGYNDVHGVPERWTLNSGIVLAKQTGLTWRFVGSSGSVYLCDASKYKINNMMQAALNSWLERVKEKTRIKIKILPLDAVAKIYGRDGGD